MTVLESPDLSLFFHSAKLPLGNVSERKDEMRLGMTLTSNPKDGSFVVGHMTQNTPVNSAELQFVTSGSD